MNTFFIDLTNTELGMRAPDPALSLTNCMSSDRPLSHPGPQSPHLYNEEAGPDDPKELSSLKSLGSEN